MATTSRRQTQIPQQAFDFRFPSDADLNCGHKNFTRELFGVLMTGVMQVFDNLSLSSDELLAVIEALLRVFHLLSNNFFAHRGTTR